MRNKLVHTPMALLLLMVWPLIGLAQQAQVDSLEALLKGRYSKSDTARVRLLVTTSDLLLKIDPDRSLDYSKEALRLSVLLGDNSYLSRIYNSTGTANRLKGDYGKALTFHYKALESDKKVKNRKDEALSLNNIGNVYLMQGQYGQAVSNYELSLRIRQDLGDKEGVASSLNNLGLVYKNQGDLDRALAYYQNALRMFEQMGDGIGRANALNNIGIIYRAHGNQERALDHFLKALDIFREVGNNVGEANTLNNIGNIYYQQQKFDQALSMYDRSLGISEKLGDKNAMAGKLSNIGGVHLQLGNKEKALESTRRALNVQKQIGDDKGQISTLNNLGAYFKEDGDLDQSLKYYQNAEFLQRKIGDHSYTTTTLTSIGLIYKEKKQPQMGLTYLQRALKEAKRYGSTDDQITVFEHLSQTYADLGDFKRSYDHQQKAVNMRDSLDRQVSTRQLAEMQAKFESEQKQREIELLNKEKEVQQLRLTKQITVRNMVIVLSVLALLLAVLLYGRYRTKKRAAEELDRKNREIEKQKKAVEEKNQEITSSIQYAKRIQDAIMPSMDEIRTVMPDSFVYYRPKEIVSGDFYWFSKQGKRAFIAAVDCTGHGVPGAFMSMIGNDHLNQIVNVEKVASPEVILNRLHHEIQITLKQKHGVSENHDGMDIALCVIDPATDKLLFSSANRFLYRVRNSEVLEVRGDTANIGGIMHEDVRKYALHEVDRQAGDVFYIFSDGVSDQFGGEDGKKFGYKRLKELLVEMHALPVAEQRALFEQRLLAWMGNNDQIDDFLLIGFRV